MSTRTAEELHADLEAELENATKMGVLRSLGMYSGPDPRELRALLELNERLARIEAHLAGPWAGLKMEPQR
jgi:hypothetical protein